jgi:hypothetical protein
MLYDDERSILLLEAVFWEGSHDQTGADARVHVEDAAIVCITRADGLQVRLTVYELKLVNNFVHSEVFRQVAAKIMALPESELRVRRIAGCESTNHSVCYGELWQCASCGKTVCANEGTDNDLDLCDACWGKRHFPHFGPSQPDDEVPF